MSNKDAIVTERIKSMSNAIPHAMFLIDEKAQILLANAAAEKAFGFKQEEILGNILCELETFADETSKIILENEMKRMRSQVVEPYEVTFKDGTGNRRYAEVKGNIITRNGRPADLVVFLDLTERKIAEELNKTQVLMDSIVNSTKDMIWSVNADDFCLLTFNKAVNDDFLRTQNLQLKVGLSLEEVMPTRQIAQQWAQLYRRVLTEGLVSMEYSTLKEPRVLELTFSVLKNSKKPFGIAVFARDITERKKAEQGLNISERRAKAIVENSPIGIATSSGRDKRFLSANSKFCSILGYSEDELKKLTFKDITHPDDLNESVVSMGLLEDGTIPCFHQEKRYFRKDGSVINGKISVSSLKDENGKPSLFIAELEDVTEHKKAKTALLESKSWLDVVFESMNEAIVTFDASGNVNGFNKAFLDYYGFKEKNEVPKSIREFGDLIEVRTLEGNLVPPEKFTSVRALKGEKGSEEYIVRRKDTGRQWITNYNFAPALLENKIVGMTMTLTNITESKIKDMELMLEKNKIEAVTQSIGAGFVTIGKDYKVQWANKFIKEYKGDVEGKYCYATLNDLNQPCPDCGVKKVFEKGANFDTHEYTSVDIKGNPYCVELIATPIKDAKGNVISAVEIAVDITEKKKLQKALADYSHNLEQLVEQRTEQLKETQRKLVKSERLAAIGELAGMVGHDLRNPLTGIKNAAYFLEKKGSQISAEQSRSMLRTIDRCVEHSNKIINDLLDYSREIYLERKESSPLNMLSESLTMVQIPENVKILNFLASKPLLNVDPQKMQRVFINLIKNAIDAMPNGGTLIIRSKQSNKNFQISITDTGTGIAEELLPKIFSPLVTSKAQGMGFGLAICKRIVEAHEGKITVKTTQGKGTTFIVTLPLKPKIEEGGEVFWKTVPKSSSLMMMKQ